MITAYNDLEGVVRAATPEALVAVLAALGLPIRSPADSPEAEKWLTARDSAGGLPPVLVAWEGVLRRLSFFAPQEAAAGGGFELSLDSDDGTSRLLSLESATSDRRTRLSSQRTPRLPIGYHRLALSAGSKSWEALVIAAPKRAYAPDASRFPCWGLFAPTYSLHTERSWGGGDFSDADRIVKYASEKGASVLGTLPLLATYLREPCHPSPYWPVSRLFWNEFFVDPERLPEFEQSPRARHLFGSLDFQSALSARRAEPLVDYRRQMALKRELLEIVGRELLAGVVPARLREFKRFIKSRPDLEDYANFRAMQEALSQDWHDWPDAPRSGLTPKAGLPEQLVNYHLYVQWLAEEQTSALAKGADEKGVTLYLDLPVGVHPNGYDTWRYREAFALGIAVGAPPDPLGPDGQNWGFPPLHPSRLRERKDDYFIEMIRRHTRLAGMLRIDHVMGFHRLFWVPDGMPGSRGVYVRYRADEFYAIVCLESHRNRCFIVGEDLGTVPDEVRAEMGRRNVRRLYVLPFEARPDAENPLSEVPAGAVASLNTHDMAPFAGFWQGSDISDRVALGSLPPDQEAGEFDLRRGLTGAIRCHLIKSNLWTEQESDETLAAVAAAHRYLADSPAGVVLVNLEDLWGETEPQNRPGTVDPIPNWRRKCALTMEQIAADGRIAAALADINNWRTKGGVRVSPKKTTEGGVQPSRSGSGHKLDKTPPVVVVGPSRPHFLLTDDDKFLFNEGSHFRLYEKLGARVVTVNGETGCHFAVWAPDAESVHVIGDFNGWNRDRHPLFANGQSGVWEAFIPGVGETFIYKLFIRSRYDGFQAEKADPFATHTETSPKTGSIVWNSAYPWGDGEWMSSRSERNKLGAPISIYEMHTGSWRRVVEQGDRPLSYRELAGLLPDYIREMGFTHVEFLPLMEHPFYGSWGYQTTGYFASTSRYGTPQELMGLIDALHQHGIGVILDWTPSHFPTDGHGLAYFDGTHLYEHADGRKGFHPDWESAIFNYGRSEVRSFLISSAIYWLDKFHADGLRVDAVASMLYLDYSREPDEWIPNKFGGRENLEAIDFLRRLNEAVYLNYPNAQMIAEESTAWPAVSRPTYLGGLGFGLKWDMGWMHDTLDYFARDPLFRRYHHGTLTFRMLYAWHENFVLPLSHDEVVHGKGSLLGRMPGDLWQKFANLRLLFTSLWTQPGKKLLFMGGEIGQWGEWNHERSLDWHLLDYPSHAGLRRLVADLNLLYREEAALHELDCDPVGFEWVDCNDADASVVSFLRKGRQVEGQILVVLNYTPVTRDDYRVGVPRGGVWRELLNSDSEHYGGSGKGNLGEVHSTGVPFHGRPDSLLITVPPLGGVILRIRDRG